MLIGVNFCQDATLLEITCHGSNCLTHQFKHLFWVQKTPSQLHKFHDLYSSFSSSFMAAIKFLSSY